MNLTKCKACGKEVAKNAKSCPNCGFLLPPDGASITANIIIWVFMIPAIVFLIYGLVSCSDAIFK